MFRGRKMALKYNKEIYQLLINLARRNYPNTNVWCDFNDRLFTCFICKPMRTWVAPYPSVKEHGIQHLKNLLPFI